jgi:hypothetical protein
METSMFATFGVERKSFATRQTQESNFESLELEVDSLNNRDRSFD